MARTIDNAYLLSQWLHEKFGEKEFTDAQFMEERWAGLEDNGTYRYGGSSGYGGYGGCGGWRW